MDGFSLGLLFIVIYAAVFVLLVVALLPEGDITSDGVFYLPCAKLCKIKKEPPKVRRLIFDVLLRVCGGGTL